MKQLICILLLAIVSAPLAVQAQLKTPQPSPTSKLTQDVGLSKIEIEYSRPSAKGRKVYGELVPFGALWRTGANASTKVNFADDVKIGKELAALPKGAYALYTIPGAAEWTIIFYKNTTLWGAPEQIKDEEVALKVTVPVQKITEKVETFTISVNNLRNNGADLELIWENTKVAIPFQFDTDSKVMADIKNQMDGPSAGTYYSAARYYYEEKKDMKLALEWVDKALQKGGDKYWILRQKALIQAELGLYKEAVETAKASSALAEKEGGSDYSRMNEKSIAEWQLKIK